MAGTLQRRDARCSAGHLPHDVARRLGAATSGLAQGCGHGCASRHIRRNPNALLAEVPPPTGRSKFGRRQTALLRAYR